MNNIHETPTDQEKDLKQVAIDFGHRIRHLRKASGLTQQDLADRLAREDRTYHQTTIAKLESAARPTTLDELILLAATFDVSLGELLRDPTPAERARYMVREANRERLNLRAQADAAHARHLQLVDELQNATDTYRARLNALAAVDPEGAAELMDQNASTTEPDESPHPRATRHFQDQRKAPHP